MASEQDAAENEMLVGAGDLVRAGHWADAIGIYDDFLDRYGEVDTDRVAFALENKAACLAALGQLDEAMQAYDHLLARFGQSESPYARTRVARALTSKSAILSQYGRADEAIVVYDALIARLDGATDPGLLDLLASAISEKGKLLFDQQRFDEAIETFDSLLDRFGRTGSELQKFAVIALNNKAAALNHLGRTEDALAAHQQLVDGFGPEAIAAFDFAIRKFVDATEPGQREQLAGALFGKAALLSELNQREAAIATFTQLIETFEDDHGVKIVHLIAGAREERNRLLEEANDDD